eukprot:scaffold17767_cov168-Amphora_coffeaeformis.AAC.2
MKVLALTLATVVACVQAFVPQQQNARPTAFFLNGEAKQLFEPAEKVPCFGAAPLIGGEVFIGENYWNKLTSEYGSADTGDFLRAAELKHGRSAMLATVGFAFQKLGITFDKISPHEYLSVTQNIKFVDLAAVSPVEAVKMIPALGFGQIFAAIAVIEIYELTHRDGQFVTSDSVAPGLQSGGLNGYNLNWNPLKIKITDRRKLVEIQNGRAAMFAICAWFAAETVPGSVPLPLPW